VWVGFAGYSQERLRRETKECDGMWVVRQKAGLARVLWWRVKHRDLGWVGKSGKVEVKCGIAGGRMVRAVAWIFLLGRALLPDFYGEENGCACKIYGRCTAFCGEIFTATDRRLKGVW